jgi:uncharacterized membrane-anchored protein YhcB (DUF1043 family)
MTFGWPVLVICFLVGTGLGLMLNFRLMRSSAEKKAQDGIEDEKKRLESQRVQWIQKNELLLDRVTAAEQARDEAIKRAERAERLAMNERKRRENAVAKARRIKSSAQRGAKTAHPATGPGDPRGQNPTDPVQRESENPSGQVQTRR